MASIFDQHQPKSALAQGLNEAFAGCDKWSIAPPRRRTADTLPPPTATGFRPQALEAPAWIQPQP
jgi:hypothetical protein